MREILLLFVQEFHAQRTKNLGAEFALRLRQNSGFRKQKPEIRTRHERWGRPPPGNPYRRTRPTGSRRRGQPNQQTRRHCPMNRPLTSTSHLMIWRTSIPKRCRPGPTPLPASGRWGAYAPAWSVPACSRPCWHMRTRTACPTDRGAGRRRPRPVPTPPPWAGAPCRPDRSRPAAAAPRSASHSRRRPHTN